MVETDWHRRPDERTRIVSVMLKLSPRAMNAAREFVMKSARPLDRESWRFHLEDGTEDAVWDELSRFQNDDGGFGRALEPDLRAAESSVLATLSALDVAMELGDPSHELVTDAVAYLVAVFDDDRGVWRFLPEELKPAPHAPWWDQESLEETFDGFVVNPRAKVLAHLIWADRPESAGIVDRVLLPMIDVVDRLDAPLSVNDLECIRILGMRLGGEQGASLLDRYGDLAEASVERDPAAWAGYVVRPLDVVTDPSEALHRRLSDLVDAHLDFEIERQSADGSWKPTWSWFGHHPDAWPTAERDWSGHLTLGTVRTLARFDRIG